jgi:hypothetical protein
MMTILICEFVMPFPLWDIIRAAELKRGLIHSITVSPAVRRESKCSIGSAGALHACLEPWQKENEEALEVPSALRQLSSLQQV